MTAIEIARRWRRQSQNDAHAQTGVVLIYNGQVYGWKNCLRDAKHEMPGAIAVDMDGNVFIAQGGDDYNGAKVWVVSH